MSLSDQVTRALLPASPAGPKKSTSKQHSSRSLLVKLTASVDASQTARVWQDQTDTRYDENAVLWR